MGLYAEFSIERDWGFSHVLEAEVPECGSTSIELDYSPACQVFIDTFMDLALSFVPVDTGFLESTIEAGTDGDTCWAEAWADYAQYVEYGTSIMSAQPFFEDALETAVTDAFFVAAAIFRKGCEEMEDWLESAREEIEARREEEEAEAEGDDELASEEEGEEDEEPEEESSNGNSDYYNALSLLAAFMLALIQAIIEILFDWEKNKSRGIPEGAVASMPEVIIT